MNKINTNLRDKIGNTKKVKLNEISNIINNRNKNNLPFPIMTISSKEGIVKQYDYYSSNTSITSNNLENYNIITKNNFAYNKSYSKGAPWGAIRIMPLREGLLSSAYFTFKITDHELITYYKYFFISSYWHKYIMKISQEGARNHGMLNMSKDDFFKLPVLTYEKHKSIQIANLLSSIDILIENQEKLIQLLRKKKSFYIEILTVNIFNKEINKSLIKLSNNNYKIKYLKEILEEISIKTTKNNENDILSSTKDKILLQKEYFNNQVASSNNIGYKKVFKNNIVLSPQNAWMGNININDKYDIGIVSPSYRVYKLKEINHTFFKYIIKTNQFINLIKINSDSGASNVRKTLNLESFLNENIYIPPIDIQIEFANLLSSMDNFIKIYYLYHKSYMNYYKYFIFIKKLIKLSLFIFKILL